MRLTKEQVLAIINDSRTQNIIAAKYNISQGQVSAIKNHKNWRHI